VPGWLKWSGAAVLAVMLIGAWLVFGTGRGYLSFPLVILSTSWSFLLLRYNRNLARR
jgi:hypothetical protein